PGARPSGRARAGTAQRSRSGLPRSNNFPPPAHRRHAPSPRFGGHALRAASFGDAGTAIALSGRSVPNAFGRRIQRSEDASRAVVPVLLLQSCSVVLETRDPAGTSSLS